MFYSNSVYSILVLFFIYMLVQKKINLFQVLIFVSPFQSWFFNIGLNLTAFQVMTIILFLWTTLSITLGRNLDLFSYKNKYLLIFMVYLITNTLFASAFMIENFIHIGGFLRSEGRFIAQIILWLLAFSIIPIAYNYVKSIEAVKMYLKTFLYALVLLVILGWIQYGIYNIMGFDIFPIDFYADGRPRTGIWTYMGSGVFRISSLGGEPKGLAQSLIIGFFIIHIANKQDISFFKYDVILKYIFLITMFATLSTSGFVLFTILFIIYNIYKLFKEKVYVRFTLKKALFSIIIIAFVAITITKNNQVITTIFDERISDRDIMSEDYDAPIQLLLYNEPQYLLFGTGAGNVHNLATKYIPAEYAYYMSGRIFVAKSGYLKFISEFGLIGFVLFILFNLFTLKKLYYGNTLDPYSNKVIITMNYLLVILFFALLARVYVLNVYLIILALSLATVNILKYKRVNYEN